MLPRAFENPLCQGGNLLEVRKTGPNSGSLDEVMLDPNDLTLMIHAHRRDEMIIPLFPAFVKTHLEGFEVGFEVGLQILNIGKI